MMRSKMKPFVNIQSYSQAKKKKSDFEIILYVSGNIIFNFSLI